MPMPILLYGLECVYLCPNLTLNQWTVVARFCNEAIEDSKS